MRRESTAGRVLWVALLVALGAYVAADFIRSPFLASSGSAAVRPAQLTLWVPAPAGGETGAVVRGAAAGLTLAGHPTVVKELPGGTSQGVSSFLARPPRGPGANALVLASGTLADLAHDRHDRLVPGAAEQAALAGALLGRAVPLGILASEPLAVAVAGDSPVRGPKQLLDSLRAAPWRQLFAIADDTWSRSQLAALVSRSGMVGHARFRVFHSAALAGQAVASGGATAVLGARSAFRADVRRGRLRALAWPLGGRAPRAWIALVAPARLSPQRSARLRRWLGTLLRDRRWRRLLADEGRRPGPAGEARLATLLRRGAARADRMELLARRVERR